MFSGGFTEIGFILFIAFLLFGPKKLPEISRTLGKGLAELRRASNDLRYSLEEEIRNLDRPDSNTSYSGTLDSVEAETSYSSGEETHPYVEAGEASHVYEGITDEELSREPEADLEPASEYGYDYSASPEAEPEPRPRE